LLNWLSGTPKVCWAPSVQQPEQILRGTAISKAAQQNQDGLAAKLDNIVRYWPIRPCFEYHHLTAGRNNTSYKLKTDDGDFVLRQCRDSKTPEGLMFEHQVIRHLRSEGIPAPEFICGRSGQRWLSEAGKLWTLSPFMIGTQPFRNRQAAGHGGDVLARFHKALETFSFPGSVPPEENRIAEIIGIMQYCKSMDIIPTGLPGLVERSIKAARDTEIFLRLSSCMLPRTIVHGSCRLTSLLLENNEIAALLDMDSARFGTRAEDFGIALASFAKCRSGGLALDEELASTLAGEYRSVAAIESNQAAAIPGYLAQSLLYSWAKAFERYVHSAKPESALLDKARWRLQAAEHALADPDRIIRLVLARKYI
jgi:homoserine kinase type II